MQSQKFVVDIFYLTYQLHLKKKKEKKRVFIVMM